MSCAATSTPHPRKWRVQEVRGERPSRRSGHTTLADSTGTYVYTFGGYHDGKCYGELYQLHVASMTWRQVKTSGQAPSVSASHSALVDGDFLLVFGGSGVPFGHSNSNSLHICDLRTFVWHKLECTGDVPCARYGQTMVMTEDGHHLYVFGGTSGLTFFNDLYRLHLPTRTWERIAQRNQPPSPCYRHEAIIHGNTMYVIGGGHPNPAMTGPIKVYAFDMLRNAWTELKARAAVKGGKVPRDRRSHSCVLHDNKVYICGGTNGVRVFSDLWVLDMATMKWTEIHATGFESKYFHAATITAEGRMHVFGGCLDLEGKRRSDDVVSCWIRVPTLTSLCVDVLARDPNLCEDDLEQQGVPEHLIELVRSEACGEGDGTSRRQSLRVCGSSSAGLGMEPCRVTVGAHSQA
eukprot:comp22209_c0_seq1/m.32683 comp22209_c0_seq1/g.32683  ORF comp22209_c0_seq1/g.32683 comp22209_c0_seq1/m.32683 type:complete len:406 (-) comp22209_c0_seq1:59-1276(-)